MEEQMSATSSTQTPCLPFDPGRVSEHLRVGRSFTNAVMSDWTAVSMGEIGKLKSYVYQMSCVHLNTLAVPFHMFGGSKLQFRLLQC